MDSQAALFRLKEFQIDGHRRKVAQIHTMIAEFELLAGELDREIRAEQDRTGIHDPAHFAYSTYARAASQRRDNLKRSTFELKLKLDDAKKALGEVIVEMVALPDERRRMRTQAS
jgi:hypothetical protein